MMKLELEPQPWTTRDAFMAEHAEYIINRVGCGERREDGLGEGEGESGDSVRCGIWTETAVKEEGPADT